MIKSFTKSFAIVAAMWIIFLLNLAVGMNFNSYGILPRESEGIKGILFAPFLHANFEHLLSNTVPMLVLGTTLFWFYPKIAVRVLLLSMVMGGALVWILGRTSYHIGASGVIFSLVGFLVASGLFRKKFKAFLVGLAVFLFYGGIIWGVLPTQPGVSWESHLFGFISGVALAYIFRDANS
ncbi:MAG: rhomboid family intramembrane serine protease [Bacteroidales bacterium]